jgi:hypothetical protein
MTILEQKDLNIEEQEEMGLVDLGNEPHLCENTLEWIETAAYYLWLEEGCPDGEHLAHWNRAYNLFQEHCDKDDRND